MSFVRTSFVFCIAYLTLLFACGDANTQQQQTKGSLVEQLNEDNWDVILTGEWMVEFYAPWCPACKALEPIWESLAIKKEELNINVGKIDVTDSPGLSGRFMVTALPTIFHVNDGIFRQYKSPRDKTSLIEFIVQKTWKKVDPIPSWKNPTSFHMSILSQFFKLSQVLRCELPQQKKKETKEITYYMPFQIIHNKLLEEIGLPTWGSYLIFAVATIILGAVLGLLIVCLIDFFYPPKLQQGKKKQTDTLGDSAQEKGSDEFEIVENIEDDLVDEEESEAEETKELETKESNEPEASEKDKDTKDTSSPNVRKRKPRKAD